MDKPFTCGRQDLSGPFKFEPAHLREDGTCSFCGSMSAERFFAAVEAGCEVGPTDKNYKVYVDLPTENPGALEIVTSSNSPQTGEGWMEATPEVCAQYGWKPWSDGPMWVKPSPTPPTKMGKFYFQHLDREGQDRFIALVNAKTMKLGYPGYFYAMPFFCSAKVDP